PPTPPRKLNPKLPPWLANLITRLLAKDPNDRPQSAKEVAQTISAQSDLGTVSLRLLLGKRSRLRRFLLQSTVTTILIVALAAGALFLTEKTGRSHLVNTLLCTRSSHTIFIDKKWGTFPSLQTAAEAATPNDTLLIRTNDEIRPGVLRLSDPDKPLTIRAAHGFSPALAHPGNEQGTFIATYAPLTLEGLTFRQLDPGAGPTSFISAKDVSLTLRNCKIVRTPMGKRDESDPPWQSCIFLTDCPHLKIINTEIYAISSTILFSRTTTARSEPARFTFDNSMFIGRIINLRINEPVTQELTLTNNQISTDLFFEVSGRNPDIISVTVNIHNNLIQLFDRLFWSPKGSLDSYRNSITWNGNDNIYLGDAIFAGSTQITSPVTTFDDWRAFLASANSPSPEPDSLWSAETIDSRPPPNITRPRDEPFGLSLPESLFKNPPPVGPNLPTLGPGSQYQNSTSDF
ncbi:MAG: hypothetical protein AAF591_20495, partial [Verrucomicrobiota bacterium]